MIEIPKFISGKAVGHPGSQASAHGPSTPVGKATIGKKSIALLQYSNISTVNWVLTASLILGKFWYAVVHIWPAPLSPFDQNFKDYEFLRSQELHSSGCIISLHVRCWDC